MAPTVPKPRELQRRTALAHLDAEALLRDIECEHEAGTQAVAPEVVARWAEIMKQIVDMLDTPVGITVEQAADRLGVTQPTIRRWLREGLLRRTSGRKPMEVEPRSVLELQVVLRNAREAYPDRQWTKALAAYLHDRDLQNQGWARQGREELARGELVEL